MGENIVEKILQAHLREGDYVPGREIAVGIDQTLVHDATGTMAFLQFEALGIEAIRTERSVTYIDHNTQQIGFENSDDHLITPAGARLKYRSNVPQYAEFVFEHIDPSSARRCLENKAQGVHNVIVAGESYGQGSSREHASMCPMYLGVKAVVAKSFERIHSANLVNFGILPLVLRNPADFDGIRPDNGLSAANWRKAVAKGEAIVLRNERSGAAIECSCELSARQTDVVLAGGLLNYITSA